MQATDGERHDRSLLRVSACGLVLVLMVLSPLGCRGMAPGTLAWRYGTGHWILSSPAIGRDGTIYVGSNDYHLYAISSDGGLEWRYETGGLVCGSPAIGSGGTIYVGSYDDSIYALSPDGGLKWRYETGGDVRSSPATGLDGAIYVSSYDGFLYALEPDGTLAWRVGGESERSIFSSPAIGSDGTIYIGSNDDHLYAFDPNGRVVWRYETGDNISSSPAIGGDGTIYVGSWDNHLYAVSPDGVLRWKHRNEDEEGIYGSATIGSDGTIYVGSSDGRLSAFTSAGVHLWSYETADTISSSPAIGGDGTIYVGSWDGGIYAVAADGAPMWRLEAGGAVSSSPAIGSDGTIYVGSWDGYLMAVRTSSEGVADASWPMYGHDALHTGRQALQVNSAPRAEFQWYVVSDADARLIVEPRLGDTIRFDASASSDPDGSIVEYAWDWTSDGAFDQTLPTSCVDRRMEAGGEYRVTLRVTDDRGRTDHVVETVTVAGNLPPLAGFMVVPPTAEVGVTISFVDDSSDADGSLISWLWSFGDGETATERSPSHAYACAGSYEVRLTVTDDRGETATHAENVTVDPNGVVEPIDIWALVIGVSDYREVNDLTYARADAEAFAQWLDDSGVDAEHVRVLLDGEADSDAGGVARDIATLSGVRAGLGWLRRHADEEDLVFVYFAGHGYQGLDDDGDEADGVDEFLVLHDTVRDAVEDTALRDDEFGRFLDLIESKHVMVIFDSCHSGGASRSLSSGTRPLEDTFDLFNDFSLEGKLVFSAAREDQEALENEALGHGIFTYFLIQGLEGAADADADYRITAEELSAYVAREVEDFARQVQGREQTPELTGRGAIGVVLSRTNRPPEASFVVEPQSPYAGGATRFEDRSTDDGGIVTWRWTFGDGYSSDLKDPTHVYESLGSYVVGHSVIDDHGDVARTELHIEVAAAGEVTAMTDQTIIISLGSSNGVKVGDRFEVVRCLTLADGRQILERKASIEVIELIGSDRSACRLIEEWLPIQETDGVRPG